MNDDQRARLLQRAEFNPGVKSYWLLSGTVLCLVTIVGIPFLPIFLLVGFFFVSKYLDAMECELTTRSLRVKKGVFNKIEKTIPLDKITDLAMYQGPIMRMMDLYGLRIETAGQGAGAGSSLVSLVGVKDAREFRDAVLAQRDVVTESRGGTTASSPPTAPDLGSETVLIEIRDALLRIEANQERDIRGHS